MQDEPLRAHYMFVPAHLSDNGTMVEISETTNLPSDWRTQAGRETLQTLGGECLRQSRSCALVVPSAVMPAELNSLINPLHPDFKNILLGEPGTLITDMLLR